MSRYFLHLNNSDGWTYDEEGQEIDDADAALEVALREVRALLAADVVSGRPIRMSSYVAVYDEGDSEIARVRYDQAVTLV